MGTLDSGVIVSLLTGGGVGIRLLLSPDWHSFAAWFAGACFIPSFALACGVWSGSGKMFEAIYTVWWYIGPAHQMPGIDFMGVSSASSTPGIYAVATVLFVAVAYYGRRAPASSQLRNCETQIAGKEIPAIRPSEDGCCFAMLV